MSIVLAAAKAKADAAATRGPLVAGRSEEGKPSSSSAAAFGGSAVDECDGRYRRTTAGPVVHAERDAVRLSVSHF